MYIYIYIFLYPDIYYFSHIFLKQIGIIFLIFLFIVKSIETCFGMGYISTKFIIIIIIIIIKISLHSWQDACYVLTAEPLPRGEQ